MFVSRAAARRRLHRARVRFIEAAMARSLQAHFDRLFVSALLHGADANQLTGTTAVAGASDLTYAKVQAAVDLVESLLHGDD